MGGVEVNRHHGSNTLLSSLRLARENERHKPEITYREGADPLPRRLRC